MKITILIASFLMSSAAAFAQHEVGTLTLHPRAGLNVAYFTGSGGVDTKPRLGFAVGAELEYQLRKRLGLSAGVVYSWQGEKATIPAKGFPSTGNMRMTAKTDYINFPILANIYMLQGLALKFGVQPAVNVKAGYSATTAFGEQDGNLSYYGINVRTFDFAIPVGLSYEYKAFVIDARYNIGVTKVAYGDDSRNRVFQITLGFKTAL